MMTRLSSGLVDDDRSQGKWSNKGRDETEASRLSALESYDNGRCTAPHKTK